MGVWGLMSFMQMTSRPVSTQLSFSESSKPCVVLVDGHAFSYYIFQRCEDCVWWDGGDLGLVSKKVKDWVEGMRACGIESRFIFDGLMDPFKRETTIRRRQQSAQSVIDTLQRARRGQAIGRTDFVLPLGGVETVIDALIASGVPCRRALYEADQDLAADAKKLNAIGVVSNDSDFVCMQIPLIPLNEIQVSAKAVHAAVYKPEAVAKSLNIRMDQLPLLACLCGNDYLPRDRLAAFHKSVSASPKSVQAKDVILAVCSLLSDLPAPQDAAAADEQQRALVQRMFLDAGAEELERWAEKMAEAVRRYAVHVVERPTSLSRQRGVEGCVARWAGMHEALALSPEVLQLALHREVFCRVAVELTPDGRHALGAQQRVARLRRLWAELVLRAVEAEDGSSTADEQGRELDGGSERLKEAAQVQQSFRLMTVTRAEMPHVGAVGDPAQMGVAQRRALLLGFAAEDGGQEERSREGGSHEGASGGHEGASGGHEAVGEETAHKVKGVRGEKQTAAERLLCVEEGAVLLAVALLELAHVERGAKGHGVKMSARMLGGLAAMALAPTAVVEGWRGAQRGRGGSEDEDREEAVDVDCVCAGQCLVAAVGAVNTLNEVLGKPFPPQRYDVMCPALLKLLVRARGGVKEALRTLEGAPEGLKTEWEKKWSVVMTAVLTGEDARGQGTGESRKKQKREEREGQKKPAKKKDKSAERMSNMFALLGEEDE